jgi:hypothetical protein
MDNEKLLRMIDAAMKGGITELTDFGASILQPEKLTKLIRKVQLATKILPQARYTNMTAHIHDIDRVSFTGRILKSGTDGASVHRSLSTSDYAKPTFATNQLIAKEFIAIASLRDSALRRNIERENFEDTLIDLIGEAVGRDLEEFALFANSDDISYNDDDVLSKTKGWIASAANAVYGVGTSKDFDPSDDTYPENMFDEMLEATPKEYLNDPNKWRFWVDWTTRKAYLDLIKARKTALGDSIYKGELPDYEGIPVEYVPLLARATTENNGCGRVAILGFPDNFAWGVFHQVGIEREREAKERRTDFVLTVEADAKFEDENATTIAYIEGTNPES